MSYYDFCFEGELILYHVGTMPYRALVLPEELEAELPFAEYPRLRVEGEVAEHPIEGAFQPAGVGYKYIMISPKLMKDAGLNIGDVVEMRFRVADQNAVDVPPELLEALAANDAAQTVWDTLTVGKKRGFSFLVETAKQRATKSKRCAQILEELAINGAKATPQLRGKKR